MATTRSRKPRLICRVEFDAIRIVSVFLKTTTRTSNSEIDGCKRRLAAYDGAAKKGSKKCTRTRGRPWKRPDSSSRTPRTSSSSPLRSGNSLSSGLRSVEAFARRRERQHMTQTDLAKKLKTSQPRVAKIEAGSSGVSLDLMFRGLFALGGTVKDVWATK